MTEDEKLDLDELMDRDPLSLANTPGGIEKVIDYHRRQRARRASGEKPSRDTAGPKIDLSKIISGLKPKPAGPIIKRRV